VEQGFSVHPSRRFVMQALEVFVHAGKLKEPIRHSIRIFTLFDIPTPKTRVENNTLHQILTVGWSALAQGACPRDLGRNLMPSPIRRL
jgi:hypothetical protein